MVTLFRRELRVWILVAIAVSAVPFFLFALYALNELGKSEHERVTAQLLNSAQSTANTVSQRLAVGVGYLTTLATSDAARNNDLPALYAHAQRVMHQLPDASAISLVAPDDTIVFLTLRPYGTKGLVASEMDAVRAVFETGKPTVSGPFKAPISDKIVTSLGVPIWQGGKVVYCLRLILLTSSLNDLLVAQQLPEDWTLAIVAGNGKVVARSRSPEKFVGEQVRADILAGTRARTPAVLDTTTLEGEPVKAALAPVPGWDWSIAVGSPLSKLNGAVNKAHVLLAMFGLAIAVLGALAGHGVQRLAASNRPATERAGFDVPLRQIRGLWPAVLALAVAMALSVTAALATQSSLALMRHRADQRLAANAMRTQIVELLSLFKDLETGQRGYVITGRDAFLAPYRHALEKIPQLVTSLKSAMLKEEIEGFNWRELDALAASRQALAAEAIDDRLTKGEAVLKDAALFDQGRLVMDKLRLALGGLEGLLMRRVDALTTQLHDESEQAMHVQWLSALAAGMLVSFFIGFWLLERARRKRLYQELAASHERLESRVQTRTAELQRASEQIRNFSAESQRSIEAERKRLSREVHDQIGQVFTGIKMILKTLQPGSLAADQQAALNTALEMGIKTTRRIAAELRPALLDDLGLRAALDVYLRTHLAAAGLSHDLDIPDGHGLNGEQMTQLFRVVQEATTNVVRHAQASHITVTLLATDAAWELQVDDDGVGWDAAQAREGSLGLVGMQERAQMLGGHVMVERRAQGGTRVAVHIPKGQAT